MTGVQTCALPIWFKNITTNFDEVFDSLPSPIETNDSYISRSKAKLSLNHDFDFEIFFEGLSKNFVDKRKITSKVKGEIERLSYIYNLDEVTMQKAFMDSLKRDKGVDLDKLCNSAKSWYQYERKPMKLSIKNKFEKQDNYTSEEIIAMCYNLRPVELVEAVFGSKPATSDLDIIVRLLDSDMLDVSDRKSVV